MTSREMLLGRARLYQERGEPIPVDMMAEAERLGLSLSLFGQPTNTEQIDAKSHQGDWINGNSKLEKETDL